MEDLKNELSGFKKTMAGVCRKYDDNFRRHGIADRQLHEGWLSHATAIEKINERCTCGVDSEDEFETVTGGEGTWKPVITCWVHLELMCIFPTM